jgi:hypothetical protein
VRASAHVASKRPYKGNKCTNASNANLPLTVHASLVGSPDPDYRKKTCSYLCSSHIAKGRRSRPNRRTVWCSVLDMNTVWCRFLDMGKLSSSWESLTNSTLEFTEQCKLPGRRHGLSVLPDCVSTHVNRISLTPTSSSASRPLVKGVASDRRITVPDSA